jgi:hypothetical protein
LAEASLDFMTIRAGSKQQACGRLGVFLILSCLLTYAYGFLASHLSALDLTEACVSNYRGYEAIGMSDIERYDVSFIPIRFDCYYRGGGTESIALTGTNWVCATLLVVGAGCIIVRLWRRTAP